MQAYGLRAQENSSLSDGRELNLESRNLQKLPPDVTEKTSLVTLTLSDNYLDTLPESFKNLTNLKTINLSNNRLMCEWPANLPESLTSINIHCCRIPTIPLEALGNLPKLVYLYISCGTLLSTFYVPAFPVTMSHLGHLQIKSARLDCVPPEMGNLVNLRYLDLSHNNLDTLPIEMKNLTSLTNINLARNQFTEIPSCVAYWTSLKTLDFNVNGLSKLSTEVLSPLIMLETLSLGHNVLGGSLECVTLDLPSLKDLRLDHNELTFLPRLSERTNKVKYVLITDNLLTRIPRYFINPILQSITSLMVSTNPIETVALELAHAPQLGPSDFSATVSLMTTEDGYLRKFMLIRVDHYKRKAIHLYLTLRECLLYMEKKLLGHSSIAFDLIALQDHIMSIVIRSLIVVTCEVVTCETLPCNDALAISLLTGP